MKKMMPKKVRMAKKVNPAAGAGEIHGLVSHRPSMSISTLLQTLPGRAPLQRIRLITR